MKKPILIGEFHFGAQERDYSPVLVMVKNQHERGVARQHFAERGAALTPIVGAHWFPHLCQSLTSRNDGANYDLGFISQLGLPTRRAVVSLNVYP